MSDFAERIGELEGELKINRAYVKSMETQLTVLNRIADKRLELCVSIRNERDAAVECIEYAWHHWAFDDYQHPRHNWHTMEDWRDMVRKKMPVVAARFQQKDTP